MASARMHTAVMDILAPWTMEEPRPVSIRGRALIDEPRLNKSTAFPVSERDAFGLRGLLPARVSTIEEQVARDSATSARSPRTRSVHRPDRVAGSQRDRLLPTPRRAPRGAHADRCTHPTVGLGCQRYSEIFRQPRGVWITPDDVDHIPEILRAVGGDRIRSDGGHGQRAHPRAGGPRGRWHGHPDRQARALHRRRGYPPVDHAACVARRRTTNQELLDDPRYIGWRHERIRGRRYDDFLEAFVDGRRAGLPARVVQWEDFKQHNAIAVLDRYRDRIPSFNDDIQGTAGVAMAGILASLRRSGATLPIAAAGVHGRRSGGYRHRPARPVGDAGSRRDERTVRRAVVMLDSRGLLVEGREGVEADKAEFALTVDEAAGEGLVGGGSLEDVVGSFRPTILVGTTGVPGMFSERAIRAMAGGTERRWSSPCRIRPRTPRRRRQTSSPGRMGGLWWRPAVRSIRCRRWAVSGSSRQANNAFVFPGLGLGAIVGRVTSISDHLFLTAAEELASAVGADRLAAGALYPPQSWLREISRRIAIRVAREAAAEGFGRTFVDDESWNRRGRRDVVPRLRAVRPGLRIDGVAAAAARDRSHATAARRGTSDGSGRGCSSRGRDTTSPSSRRSSRSSTSPGRPRPSGSSGSSGCLRHPARHRRRGHVHRRGRPADHPAVGAGRRRCGSGLLLVTALARRSSDRRWSTWGSP